MYWGRKKRKTKYDKGVEEAPYIQTSRCCCPLYQIICLNINHVKSTERVDKQIRAWYADAQICHKLKPITYYASIYWCSNKERAYTSQNLTMHLLQGMNVTTLPSPFPQAHHLSLPPTFCSPFPPRCVISPSFYIPFLPLSIPLHRSH